MFNNISCMTENLQQSMNGKKWHKKKIKFRGKGKELWEYNENERQNVKLTGDIYLLWCPWWYRSTFHCWDCTYWHGHCIYRLEKNIKTYFSYYNYYKQEFQIQYIGYCMWATLTTLRSTEIVMKKGFHIILNFLHSTTHDKIWFLSGLGIG